MRNNGSEDRDAERLTQAFLDKCLDDGRINAKELAEISMGRSGFGCEKPATLLRIKDFVDRIQDETGLPVEDIRRILALHLRSTRLTPQHLELYMNYPAWSETELAEAFFMPQQQIASHLAAVRRAWPSLRFDAPNEGKYGVPALKDMLRIETSANSDGRLDESAIIKF